LNTKTIAHVVHGLDKDAKPRAAVIPASDLDAAHRAAAGLGFKIGRAETPEALDLAKDLPELKVFVTGKGLVPLVKQQLFDRLTPLLVPIPAAPTGSSSPDKGKADASKTTDAKASPANPWQAIKVGSVVLCRDPKPGPERSWWECVVQSVTPDGKLLKVRWQNYPDQRAFTVRRNSVAILPPPA
jgi:hypothetical protein